MSGMRGFGDGKFKEEFQGVEKRQGWKGVGEEGLGEGVGNVVLGERHEARRDGMLDLSGRWKEVEAVPFSTIFFPSHTLQNPTVRALH